MTQEKLRTIEVSRERKHRTTNQILSALEVMPFGRHFTAKELATIACQHGQGFVEPNSVNAFLRDTSEGMGLIRTVASDGRAAAWYFPIPAAAPKAAQVHRTPAVEGPTPGSIHERVAGVEANLKEVLAAQGRAGDSASKAMIASVRNAEGIERVESLLKRLLVKLGEQVD